MKTSRWLMMGVSGEGAASLAEEGRRLYRPGDVVPAGIALFGLLLHLAVINSYGWFRDELYYVACGEHLAWGYVDHPPLAPWLARLSRELFGESLPALRWMPILAGALVVFLAGRLARELGGGRTAQAVASLCALIAPVYLFLFHVFSMNAFEVLFWLLGALIVVRIVNTGEGRLWLLFGLIAGLGLLNKHSMLLFGFGVFAGVLLTPERRHFAKPWIWLGGLIAALLFLPHLLWLAAHGWPTLEFMENAQRFKNVALSPLQFLSGQVLLMHPLAVPVGLAGLGWYFVGRKYRLFGWAVLAILAALMTQSSKPYYLSPVYPVLFAAGGVAIEAGLRRVRVAWLRPVLAGTLLLLLTLGGAVIAPMTLPVLPVDTFQRYQARLGIEASSGERHEMGALPQHFADMHGWQGLVDEVARVYRSLPPEERVRAGIFAQNYGEAGAIDVLGRSQGLPRAVSGHNNYFLWGPGSYDGGVLIILGGDEADNRAVCPDLRRAGTVRCGGLCMPFEDDLPVYVCRGLTPSLPELWPRLKEYL